MPLTFEQEPVMAFLNQAESEFIRTLHDNDNIDYSEETDSNQQSESDDDYESQFQLCESTLKLSPPLSDLLSPHVEPWSVRLFVQGLIPNIDAIDAPFFQMVVINTENQEHYEMDPSPSLHQQQIQLLRAVMRLFSELTQNKCVPDRLEMFEIRQNLQYFIYSFESRQRTASFEKRTAIIRALFWQFEHFSYMIRQAHLYSSFLPLNRMPPILRRIPATEWHQETPLAFIEAALDKVRKCPYLWPQFDPFDGVVKKWMSSDRFGSDDEDITFSVLQCRNKILNENDRKILLSFMQSVYLHEDVFISCVACLAHESLALHPKLYQAAKECSLEDSNFAKRDLLLFDVKRMKRDASFAERLKLDILDRLQGKIQESEYLTEVERLEAATFQVPNAMHHFVSHLCVIVANTCIFLLESQLWFQDLFSLTLDEKEQEYQLDWMKSFLKALTEQGFVLESKVALPCFEERPFRVWLDSERRRIRASVQSMNLTTGRVLPHFDSGSVC